MKKLLLYLLLSVILLLSGSITAKAQTTLSAGDIAIVRMNEDSPSDAFSFVTFVAIDAGIEIYFTEEGWYGNPGWNGNSESHLKYTAPAGGLSAGSVVHIDENVDGTTFTVSGSGGSVVYAWSTSGFNLSSGDQILAYQTSESSKPSSPTFIAGLTMNDGNSSSEPNDPATGWTLSSATTCVGVSVSRIPLGLTNGTNCISVFPDWTVLTENDNARYNCTLTTGTKAALLAAVNNHDNWLYDDATNYATSSVCSFTVTSASPEMDVQGNGTSIGDGDITPSSTDHTDFGSVAVASGTVVRTFTILNTGAGSLTLSGTPFVTVSGSSDFTVTSQPTSPVSVGGSVTFQVTFDPSASGTRSATLSIANNDTDENPYNFSIQGVGTAPEPEIKVSGNSVEIADGDASLSTADYTDFGYADISSGSVTYSYTIENQGLVALNLSGTPKVSVGGSNPADFTVIAQPSSPVAVSGSTTFQVTFNPTSTGNRSATLSITNDDTNENPYNFTIQGYGTSQNLSAGDIAFIGYNSDDPDGFTFIALTDIPSYEMIYFSDEGWNGSVWSGNPNESHYAWQAPVAGLPIGSIVYIYESAPDVLTASSGTMSGILVGTSFYYASGDQVLAYQSVSGADPASPTFIAGLHADYDLLNYNASTQWSSSALPSESSASTVPTGLTNGQNCVSLFPATTEYDNAKYNGTLTGNSNAIRTAINTYTNWIFDSSTPYDISPTGYATPSITLAAEINLLGNGVSISDGDATPSTTDDTDFGSAAVAGGTVSHTFTIENTGSLTLNLTGIPRVYIAAGDFTVTSQPSSSTITSGGSLTFTVEFNPSGTGLRTAELSIINDDSDETPYNFSIQGTGLAAPTLTTSDATAILTNGATLGGNVTSDGGATVTERGVVYSASDNTPQIGEIGVTQNTNGSGTGSFSEAIGSMPLATHYYYQAYATNSEGTSYGGVKEYTTLNQISAIIRADSDFTNATSVSWTVEFDASLTGLTSSNFSLVNTGLTGPTITGVSGGGSSWTVTANTGSGSGTLGLNFANATGLSQGIGNTLPYSGQTYTIDKTAPSAPTITGISAGYFNSNQTFTVSGEAGATIEYSTNNGGLWTAYSGAVTLSTEGTYNVLARQTDQAGNGPTTSGVITLLIDKTAPSAPTITGISAGYFNSNQTFTVSGEAGATIEYSTNNGGLWTAYSGAVTLSTEGTYNVLARQTDQAGNGPTTSGVITLLIDKTAPSAPTITGISAGYFNSNQTFTVSGEAGATIEYSTNNGGLWTAYSGAVTLSAEGTYNVLARQTDQAGNGPTTSGIIALTIDKTAPTVTINQAVGQSDPTHTGPISFTVVFNEPVGSSFVTGDVTLSGTAGATTGTVTEIAPNDGTTYNVAVSGMTGSGTVIASILAGAANDLASRPNTASTSTDNTVNYDNAAPTVNIFTAASPTTSLNIPLTAFTASDNVAVTGYLITESAAPPLVSAVGWTVVASTTYTVASDGSYTLYPWAKDAAGNVSSVFGSPANVTVDSTAPDTTITNNPFPTGLTNNTSASFTFSGNDGTGVGGLTFACDLDGGGFSACSSPKSYNSLVDDSHTFQVRAKDSLGNTDPSPATYTWTVDTISPTVLSITSTTTSPTNTSPIPVTITFSEPVCGFHPLAGDLNVTNGTTSDLTSGSDGSTVYTFDLTPSAQGLVSVYLYSGSVYDGDCITPLNYNSVDSAAFSLTYDTVSPTVTIDQAAAQTDPTTVSPVNFTVVFSEPVTGFSTGDVTLSGTAGATTGTVSGGPTIYNVAVSGMTMSGTIVATINAGVAQDAASNLNTASASTDNAVMFKFDTTMRVFVPLVMRNYVVAPDLVVERIVATSNNVQVVIKNQGNAATADDFWVDVYFNPNPAPPGINQPWRSNAPAGAAWGVTARLAPDQSLTLVTGDQYYADGSATFPIGANVYAYVDSVNYATTYGNIQESNENNNMFGPVVSTAGSAGASASFSRLTSLAGLPER